MGLIWARITSIFSFPTHTRAHFAHKLQKITKHFQCGYKTKTNWNTERIMQFFKIAAYVQVTRPYGLVHYADCAFCSYINNLRSCACWWVWLIRLFYIILACMGVECVRAFDGFVFINVDVKYIIHYKRICKFICSL